LSIETQLLDHCLLGSDVLLHPEYPCSTAIRKLDVGGYFSPFAAAIWASSNSISGWRIKRYVTCSAA